MVFFLPHLIRCVTVPLLPSGGHGLVLMDAQLMMPAGRIRVERSISYMQVTVVGRSGIQLPLVDPNHADLPRLRGIPFHAPGCFEVEDGELGVSRERSNRPSCSEE